MEQFAGTDIDLPDDQSARYRYALTVVTPTYNERDNVPALVEKLEVCLAGIDWHLVVVDDDSPDGTAHVVRYLSLSRPNVECIERKGRRGLAGAVAEGIMAASAPVVAVIDADLQHDEKALPKMLAMMTAKNLDLVVCSRFKGSRATDGLSKLRTRASHLANGLANLLSGGSLTDPMSGYFMIRRSRFVEIADQIYPDGFKILLNILMASKKSWRLEEIGIDFAPRVHGQSKLNIKIMFDFLCFVLWYKSGGFIPPRFLPFAMIGSLGLCVHLFLLHVTQEFEFFVSQLIAIMVTMAFNYSLNNIFTYSDKKKKGWDFIKGYVAFSMACAAGALINYSVALFLVLFPTPEAIAGLTGALAGGIWNFIASNKMVWAKGKPDSAIPSSKAH